MHRRSGGDKAGPSAIHIRPSSVAAIDPRSGRVLADAPADLSGFPGIAGGEGAVWAYGTQSQSLYRIDPRTYGVNPTGVAITPNSITTGGGWVWLADGWDGWLVRVDARSPNIPAVRIRMRNTSPGVNMASTRRAVWMNNGNDAGEPALLRFNAESGKVLQRYRLPPGGVAASGPYVWNAQSHRVTEVEPQRDSVGFTTFSGGPQQFCFTAGYGYAWRANGVQLFKISPAPVSVADTIHLPSSADAITTGGNLVWVATHDHIIAINPADDTVAHEWPLSGAVSAITYYGGRLWAVRN
jgi:hypothetical protein